MLGLAVLMTSTSCVDAQEFLIVERAAWVSSDCSLDASTDPPAIMILDVSFPAAYGMGFVVTNSRVQNGGSNTNLDDTEMVLDYAEVTLSFSGGSLDGGAYDYQLPTTSLRGGDSVPFLVEIPADTAASLASTMSVLPAGTHEDLIMEVIVHARTTGSPGSNARLGAMETRPFLFPLQVCYGCLEQCLPASDCGGEGDALVCPTTTEFSATCGYAQGNVIVHPSCPTPE